MDTVVRGLTIYALVFFITRLSGRRTIGETTTFDFVLLLIIAETTQQALLGDDYSITTTAVLLVTLFAADIAISLLKQRSRLLDRVLEGAPMIIVEDGRPLTARMRRARLDDADVMAAARRTQGLERMSQIKYAVLETDGAISIIPRRDAG